MQRLRAEMGGFAALSIKIPKGGGRLRRPEAKMKGVAKIAILSWLGKPAAKRRTQTIAQRAAF